jgi:hypothetical protein
MKPELKQKFIERWRKYFGNAELPIAFFYADSAGQTPVLKSSESQHCLVNNLAAIRQGQSLCFDIKSVACFGGKRYLGFSQDLMPNFEYFLSCGIPGKLEGERYKKTPELVFELLKNHPVAPAPAKMIVFKRWDALTEEDEPQVVIFFAPPDVLSGLFTLANYDEPTVEAVYCPMGAGCATIVQYPLVECRSDRPRAVLGMFDVSARPGVDPASLTFALPLQKLERMIDNMDESFLITGSWQKVRARITPTT